MTPTFAVGQGSTCKEMTLDSWEWGLSKHLTNNKQTSYSLNVISITQKEFCVDFRLCNLFTTLFEVSVLNKGCHKQDEVDLVEIVFNEALKGGNNSHQFINEYIEKELNLKKENKPVYVYLIGEGRNFSLKVIP